MGVFHSTYHSLIGLLSFSLVLLSNIVLADEQAPTSFGKLRFAVVYVEEPPFIYADNANQYKGIVPSLMLALSQELSFELEFLPIPRKRLEASIIDSTADVAWLSPDWVINKEQLVFSDSVFQHREFLYSLTPFTPGQSHTDVVSGKTICIRQDYQYPSLQPFFEQQVAQGIRVSSQVPLVTLLLKRRCDLLYMNEHRASWMLSQLAVDTPVYRTNKHLEQTDLALMFNKNWQDKIAIFNQAIAKLKETGSLNKIVQVNIQHATSQIK